MKGYQKVDLTQAEDNCYAALDHLVQARDLLKRARATKATAKVRLAITSTRGAVRHAAHAGYRT